MFIIDLILGRRREYRGIEPSKPWPRTESRSRAPTLPDPALDLGDEGDACGCLPHEFCPHVRRRAPEKKCPDCGKLDHEDGGCNV